MHNALPAMQAACNFSKSQRKHRPQPLASILRFKDATMKTKFIFIPLAACASTLLLIPNQEVQGEPKLFGTASIKYIASQDDELEKRIEKAIADNNAFDGSSITVSVDNRTTRLMGEVPKEKLIKAASKIAYKEGSEAVINELHVFQ
jgi:hypothetical protein